MNTFGPPQLVLARGEGAHVWDEDGREYVDLLGGIAVNALGHAHPAVVEAVTRQLSTLGHVSNFFATEPQIALAERLLDAGRARQAATAAGRQGVPHQLRRRGQRGGAQADPAYRPHAPRRRRGLVPRPHHGRPRADLQGGLPRAVRAAARPRHVRAVRRRRRPRGRGHRRDRRRRARADPGRGRRGRAAGRLPRGRAADHPRARRPALARRGADRDRPHRGLALRGHRPRGRARRGHPGQGPRRRHPDRRLRRSRRRPATCSSRGTTARPSAATRSPARPPSPSWTRSRPTVCSTQARKVGRPAPRRRRRRPARDRRARAAGC